MHSIFTSIFTSRDLGYLTALLVARTAHGPFKFTNAFTFMSHVLARTLFIHPNQPPHCSHLTSHAHSTKTTIVVSESVPLPAKSGAHVSHKNSGWAAVLTNDRHHNEIDRR